MTTDENQNSAAEGRSDLEGVVSCGRCKNCKHWTGEQHGGKRTCEAEFVYMGYYHSTAELPSDSVHIEDDEGWGWFTGPNFGCVHFTKRNRQ